MPAPNFTVQKVLFGIIAFTWLPAGIFLSGLIRFGLSVLEDKGGDGQVFLMAVAAISGLFLAFACRKLWQHGRKVSFYICALVLGPISIVGVIFAGLLGPLMMLFYALVISFPAWLLVFISCLRNRRQEN